MTKGDRVEIKNGALKGERGTVIGPVKARGYVAVQFDRIPRQEFEASRLRKIA